MNVCELKTRKHIYLVIDGIIDIFFRRMQGQGRLSGTFLYKNLK